jgi:tight adherence protein C
MGFLASPVAFAVLIGLATVMTWMAFAPARPARQVEERLSDYLDRDIIEHSEMERPFVSRAILPPLQRFLRFLGRLLPISNLNTIQRQLVMAGSPGGLTALDYTGLRLLVALFFGIGAFVLASRYRPLTTSLLGALFLAAMGYMIPWYWLRRRIRKRQHEIQRALPDALDMMTIGVEAGLAFETAMVRVGDRWDNALTQEFRRAVAEMRVGSTRNEALRRMADRTGVDDLRTFVTVLIQSTQLGVSIADVLHSQADQMRVKRRQRAEELARQAGIKMVFPLVFLVFPAIFVVLLGPGVPRLISFFASLQG